MGIVGGLVVYLILFWTVLFAVLPWGVKPVENPQLGNAPGAPANPNLKKKFFITAVLAGVLWLGVYTLIKVEIIDFHSIANQMMVEDHLE